MQADISPRERDSQEAKALRHLVDAEAYLQQAMLKDSKKLYLHAIKYAEKVIRDLPWSLFAHYIAAVAHLRGLNDTNYAEQKYQFLLTIKSEEANNLANKLKNAMEGTQAGWGKF
jgi:hypothetical protein